MLLEGRIGFVCAEEPEATWQVTAWCVHMVRWQEREAQRGMRQGGRQGPASSPGHRPGDPPVGEVAGRVEAGRASRDCI